MELAPTLLRLLLSLSLILNGTGFAMPVSHGLGGHGGQSGASAEAEPVAAFQLPCHEQNEAKSVQAASERHDAMPGDTSTAGTDESSADCCQHGACRCGCVHQTQVAVPAFLLRTPDISSPHSLRDPQHRHAEPALPHLMRPPIV